MQPTLDFTAPSRTPVRASRTSRDFRGAVASYFRARPGCWIDGLELETIGGKYAWRTRVSECRRQLGMTIENRLRKVGDRTVSEYQFQPEQTAKVCAIISGAENVEAFAAPDSHHSPIGEAEQ